MYKINRHLFEGSHLLLHPVHKPPLHHQTVKHSSRLASNHNLCEEDEKLILYCLLDVLLLCFISDDNICAARRQFMLVSLKKLDGFM